MSSRDERAYLDDIVASADSIAALISSTDVDDYLSDRKTRLAVERELITIGEALSRLLVVAPGCADGWRIVPRDVVGLRNVLVHGYHGVEDERVYETVTAYLPWLRDDAARTLHELDEQR